VPFVETPCSKSIVELRLHMLRKKYCQKLQASKTTKSDCFANAYNLSKLDKFHMWSFMNHGCHKLEPLTSIRSNYRVVHEKYVTKFHKFISATNIFC